VKKFWSRVEAAFKKLFGSTTWEKTASATISFVAPLLETIVGLAAGGPAATIVANIVATVQSDLATVSAVVTGATQTPPANEIQACLNALGSIKANFAALLAAAEVKNSAEATKITAVANTIIGEIDAILENLPASWSSASSATAAAATSTVSAGSASTVAKASS
jgi:hypothetical protein